MAGIDIGVSSNHLVPGTFVLTLFGQGESVAEAGERNALLVMPKLESGTWTVNQATRVRTLTEAENGAGKGSPLHRAVRRYFNTSVNGKLFVVAYDETSGGGEVSADGYFEITGTASKSGVIDFHFAGDNFSVAFSKNDTPTNIGDLLADAINGREHLPATASNSSGKVTLTAKIAGASQNGIYRLRGNVETSGTGVSVTKSGDTLGDTSAGGTAGVDGSTSEESNMSTALDSVQKRYYYTGISLNEASPLSTLTTHINDQSDPSEGKRSIGITASQETRSSVQTKAIAVNDERIVLANQQNGDDDPAVMVGNLTALLQDRQRADSAFNFDGFRDAALWKVPGVFDEDDIATNSELNDLLTDGVTPIQSDEFGSFVVMMVSTRSKTSDGSSDDKRALEQHRVSVVDDLADTLSLRDSQQFAGKKLKKDRKLRDGTVDTRTPLPENVITPHNWKNMAKRTLLDKESAGLIKDALSTIDTMVVQIDPNNSGRIEANIDVQAIDLRHQTTIRIAEVTPN